MKEKILILLAAMAMTISLRAGDKGKKTWPEEWRNVKYAKQETLPDARISKGEAVVKVRLLNYDPSKRLALMVGGFQPLGQKESFQKTYPLSDDGTATARVPLRLVRSVIVGIERLKNKESNRAASFADEFRKLGVQTAAADDQMIIYGHENHRLFGASVSSHGDHRLAMALMVASLYAEGPVKIDDTDCVAKSFPEFLDLFHRLKR